MKRVTHPPEKCKPTDLLCNLAALLFPYLEELRRAQRAPIGSDVETVDVGDAVPTIKRFAFADCRSGKLRAKKVHRHWLATRADLDEWIAANAAKDTPAETDVSDLDALAARFGLRRVS